MYAGALTTFLILFGSGISPLPTTTAESFATRDPYVRNGLVKNWTVRSWTVVIGGDT